MKKGRLAGCLSVFAGVFIMACSTGGPNVPGQPDRPYIENLFQDTDLSVATGSRIADHNAVHEIWKGRVPITAIQSAVAELHIAYGHTSHGSQILSGMDGIIDFASRGSMDGTYHYSEVNGLFNYSQDGTSGLHLFQGDGYGTGYMDHDAGYFSSTWDTDHQQNWYEETVEFLEDPANAEYNVIIWSWCGQLGGMSAEQVQNNYLTPMDNLRAAYSSKVFVYMTGHLNGSGPEGTLAANNAIIRQHCIDNNLWLYDFADIESYDPDGYRISDLSANDGCFWDSDGDGTIEGYDDHGNFTDDRNWAREWQDAHTVNVDWFESGAAHSESIIGNMKGYAAWWLWAQISAL